MGNVGKSLFFDSTYAKVRLMPNTHIYLVEYVLVFGESLSTTYCALFVCFDSLHRLDC